MIRRGVLILLAAVCLLSGCELIVFGAAAGGGVAGTYAWINGELKTDYYAPFEKTWSAVERTVANLHGVQVEPVKEISQGTINTVIDDQKVRIVVNYKEKNVTTVAVRIGTVGDKRSSQMIQDRIGDNLKK